MIKVKYNSTSNLVEGYYPSSINYSNTVIDEESKTIDDSPYVEITEEEHQNNMNKTMCVSGGIYQEYITPDKDKLKALQDSKIAICKSYLASNDWMVARKVKRNIEIPQDIIDKEILCVKAIDKLKASTTLKKVVDCDVSDYVISN